MAKKRKISEISENDDDDEFVPFVLTNQCHWLPTWNRLYAFQKEAVRFAISDQVDGRLIIGDEMGCGKTIETIAIMLYYWIQQDYLVNGKRCLIIVPSSLRDQWAYEIGDFVSFIRTIPNAINIVDKGTTPLDGVLVDVISYSLCWRKRNEIKKRKYEMIIADECHYLKSKNSQRTKALRPIMRNCNRLLLLSGTLILSKPSELYSPLYLLNKDAELEGYARDFCEYTIPIQEPNKLFRRYRDFTARYCNGHQGHFGWEDGGKTNMDELNHVLRQVMIRRKKVDVLRDLPEKIRSRVCVRLGLSNENRMRKQMDRLRDIYNQQASTGGGNTIRERLNKMYRHQQKFMEMFRMNAQVKIKAVTDYIQFYLDENLSLLEDRHRVNNNQPVRKVLLFAHHRDLMDALQMCVETWMEKRLNNKDRETTDPDHLYDPQIYIRIDGSVPSKNRSYLVDQFQTNPSVRIAILSITAAGVGLNLTAASHAIFSEMFWNPSAMLQAEDRTHRIGQTDVCHITYLIGIGSFDEKMWRILDRKMATVGEILDNIKGQKMFDPQLMSEWVNDNAMEGDDEEEGEEEEDVVSDGGGRLSRNHVSDIMMELLGLPPQL